MVQQEKDKLKALLTDTITLLCRNGLRFKTQFSVDAVIGIALDETDEFFVSIKEQVKVPATEGPHVILESNEGHSVPSQPRKRARPSEDDEDGLGQNLLPGQTQAAAAAAKEDVALTLGDMQVQGSSHEYWKDQETIAGGSGVTQTNRQHLETPKGVSAVQKKSKPHVTSVKDEPDSDSDDTDDPDVSYVSQGGSGEQYEGGLQPWPVATQQEGTPQVGIVSQLQL